MAPRVKANHRIKSNTGFGNEPTPLRASPPFRWDQRKSLPNHGCRSGVGALVMTPGPAPGHSRIFLVILHCAVSWSFCAGSPVTTCDRLCARVHCPARVGPAHPTLICHMLPPPHLHSHTYLPRPCPVPKQGHHPLFCGRVCGHWPRRPACPPAPDRPEAVRGRGRAAVRGAAGHAAAIPCGPAHGGRDDVARHCVHRGRHHLAFPQPG